MIKKHIPVLLEDSINSLITKKNGTYVDFTFGSGGHSREILNCLDENGKLISFDCDNTTKDWSLDINDQRFFYINDNFSNFEFYLQKMEIGKVDGFLFDLGLSSMQLELHRGFSYRQEESNLDMRMNQNLTLTAEEIINNFSVEELADVFFFFGDEKKSYRLAKSIFFHRKKSRIVTVKNLVRIVSGVLGKRKDKQHPAKKIFQALRIKVNNELDVLSNTLQSTFNHLSNSGRIVVISYHSLEDRITKNIFKDQISKNNNFFLLNKKPIISKTEEIQKNRKSRSAKMRAICKENIS